MRNLLNVFAVQVADPARREPARRKLRQLEGVTSVSDGPAGWLVAVAPLDESGPPESTDTIVFESDEPSLPSGGPLDPTVLGSRGHRDVGVLKLAPGEDDAIAVRSCGGLVPAYWAATPDGWAVGTRLTYFARYLPDPRLDPLQNAVWLTGHPASIEGRTFLSGVSVVRRGEFVRLRGRSAERRRYWDPRPPSVSRPDPQTAAAHASQLRTCLITALERDLAPQGNVLSLSGGVDSSLLALIARRILGAHLGSLSVLPSVSSPSYEEEVARLRRLRDEEGIEPGYEFEGDLSARLRVLDEAPPVAYHVPHPVLCYLPRVTASGDVRVLTGGEMGDETTGSLGSTTSDWLAETGLIELLRHRESLPGRDRDVLRWLVRRRRLRSSHRIGYPRTLPSFTRPELQEELTDIRRDALARVVSQDAPWRSLWHYLEVSEFTSMGWEAASSLGVRRSYPFMHRELLELVLACHPGELIGPGDKKLLRAAFRG
ncbi:MAG TPA: asparagine synthase-related protein, partial [Actinomycetota bacterium]|nr:asparagine synthase-related protein [Actinomycetota bacterium]